MINNKERKRLMKIYGFLYKRYSNCDWDKCIYCGEVKECWDHCPPISIVDDINIKKYKKNGGEFNLFPSCNKCNQYLSNYASSDLYDRFEYLLDKYKKKYKKLPKWNDEEIDQLGHTLKSHILNKRIEYNIIENKIKNIKLNLINDELFKNLI